MRGEENTGNNSASSGSGKISNLVFDDNYITANWVSACIVKAYANFDISMPSSV